MNALNSKLFALIAIPSVLILTSSCSNKSHHELEGDPPYDLSVAYHPLASDPTNLTPVAGADVTELPTFTWDTGADDDRFTIRIREYITGTYGQQDINVTRAQANCVEPDRECSYTVGTQGTDATLAAGTNIWYIKAFDDDDGDESGWARTGGFFTVNGTVRPVAVSPVGISTADNPPALVFAPVPGSLYYTVRLSDSDSSIYDYPGDLFEQYTPDFLGCADNVSNCTIPANVLTAELTDAGGTGSLVPGQVRWAVQASNNNWSANPLPPIFTIVQPCADDEFGPTCDDNNICRTGTCVVTTQNPAGVCVFTDNSLQCDDGNACTTQDRCNDGQCRADDQANCRVTTTLNPIGVTGANEDLQWNEVPNTDSYRIYIRDFLTKQIVGERTTVTAAGACSGGVCTYDPGTLPNGEFEWFVQTPPLTGGCCTQQTNAFGPQLTWHGPWSSPVRFQVGYERPVTISPIDDVSLADTTPALQWQPVTGASHQYIVRIRDANLVQRDYVVSEASAGCGGGLGTCRFTVPEVLPYGWTQWFVEANGSKLWSVHSSFCLIDGTTPCNIIF